jgi:antitoxin (DNA-binding transcriptional repressor) of toxin-antitoxin stability system
MSIRIGVRELREKLAECLESSEPIELTRHGRTIGFYVPVPASASQSSREALLAAGHRMDAELKRAGISEDEVLADFKRWRKDQHAK